MVCLEWNPRKRSVEIRKHWFFSLFSWEIESFVFIFIYRPQRNSEWTFVRTANKECFSPFFIFDSNQLVDCCTFIHFVLLCIRKNSWTISINAESGNQFERNLDFPFSLSKFSSSSGIFPSLILSVSVWFSFYWKSKFVECTLACYIFRSGILNFFLSFSFIFCCWFCTFRLNRDAIQISFADWWPFSSWTVANWLHPTQRAQI